MKTLTVEKPKPMLEVEGKPLLGHVLDRLRAAGFTDVLIVTGYQGETIERSFRDYPLSIQFVRQQQPDGTGSAALLARDFAGGSPFLLTFADIFTQPEAYRGIAELLDGDREAQAAVGVKYADDPYRGAAVYEEAGRVVRIVEKPPPGTSTTNWNSAGLFAFRPPAIFEHLSRLPLSPRGEYELTGAIAQMLEEDARVLLYDMPGSWGDIGRPEDLEAARRLVE